MNMVRQELQSVNDEIVKKQKAEDTCKSLSFSTTNSNNPNLALLPINSSTESLSSVFSNTRNSQIPVGDQQVPSLNSSYRDLRTEKVSIVAFDCEFL
jgi:hypothetical protein